METTFDMTTMRDLNFWLRCDAGGSGPPEKHSTRQRDISNASEVEKGIRVNFPRLMILARVRQRGGKWGKPGRAEIIKPGLEPVQRGPLKTKRVPDERKK
jgi:hypothetical protein